MSKWGKYFFYGTLLWQIPCIAWIFYFSEPNTSIIMGLPAAVFTYAALYLFYCVVFGVVFTWKYIDDPTGKGVPVPVSADGKEGK